MINKFLLAAALLIFSLITPVLARDHIYLIGVFDTNAPQGIGDAITVNREFIGELFKQIKNDLDGKFTVSIQIIDGDEFSIDAVRKVINPLELDKSDKVIFYYTGHGLADNNDRDPLPMLNLPDLEKHSSVYPALNIVRALQSRNPGFYMAIFEACNVIVRSPPRSQFQPLAFNGRAIEYIMEQRKHIVVATATRGQFSYIDDGGGRFTQRLLRDMLHESSLDDFISNMQVPLGSASQPQQPQVFLDDAIAEMIARSDQTR